MYSNCVCVCIRSTTEDPGMRVGQAADEEDELDKDFWIRRAGEVCFTFVCECVGVFLPLSSLSPHTVVCTATAKQ